MKLVSPQFTEDQKTDFVISNKEKFENEYGNYS